ncbi:phosphate signaling complex protein PhoU [Candidatus Xianfuyuplasma coldseepsis]|uniref:Phosphate-specific transport system accessory protein PhoU n=1 Tax=Candidatus Xianfuyuplasma coldseepsis TaxID=2782163 RepID=A0A7L7KRF6_9MOLU|nr:phosphate signaling complex protein PhoU [Xianfuyuplasma coldseepsis]QMS84989.1 phosphate signaling complex protein PhoU [Xianfuyuplasma coldseepsis]
MTNRKHFVDELNDLNNKVILMGEQVYNSYVKLISVCKAKDMDLAQQIMEQDKLINELEVSINVDAYLLIAKQCPVASDLRRIITALKISNELERIADYTVNIAKYFVKTRNNDQQFLDRIVTLASFVMEMLEGIMEAFEREDVALALKVNDADEELDEEYETYVVDLMKIAKTASDEETEVAMRALLALKQIERAGDHVTNIAENIVYLVNGKRVELN